MLDKVWNTTKLLQELISRRLTSLFVFQCTGSWSECHFCIELHHCCRESQASQSFSFSQLISVRRQLLANGVHISPTNLPSFLFAVKCCQMLIHNFSTYLGQFLATGVHIMTTRPGVFGFAVICCQMLSTSSSIMLSLTYLGQLASIEISFCQLISVSCTQLVSTSCSLTPFLVSGKQPDAWRKALFLCTSG